MNILCLYFFNLEFKKIGKYTSILKRINSKKFIKIKFSPMKPRKTRKYSKKSGNTFANDARDEIRGERKVKEYTIENIIPMEHSYASKVKGESSEQGEN